MPVLSPAIERALLLDALKKTLEGLKGTPNTATVRKLLQSTLDIVEPPSFRKRNTAVEIGAFNELGVKEIANLIDVEIGTFTLWLRQGYPPTWPLKIEPFPPVQRWNGQVRLWNGPAVADWYGRNGVALKLCYKRNKMTLGK